MNAPTKLLLIFFDESDQYGDMPLFEAILRRLVQMGISGATVQTGIMGYGVHHRIHHKRLFGVSDDKPITIAVIDEEEKIRKALPTIRPMVKEGVVILLDAEVIL
jgi:PII-like signaling protein